MRWLKLTTALAVSAVIGLALLFSLYGLSQGFHVGRGLVSLITIYPGPVEGNPVVEDVSWHRVSWIADIENRELNESSGLAASTLHNDVLWSINDSGGQAKIYAMDMQGRDIGGWLIDSDAVDWEAMDTFVLAGVAYLVIGDIGDNLAWRPHVSFLVVKEPTDLSDRGVTTLQKPIPVEWRVRFTFPGGPRDAEALAVNIATQQVLVLSKRVHPPELFALPLVPPAMGSDEEDTQVNTQDDVILAEFLYTLNDIPQSVDWEFVEAPDNAAYRYFPTGMDIAGNRLLLTTYKHAYMYDLAQPEAAALRVSLPSNGQRESLTFANKRNDIAYFSKERFDGVGVADLFMIELPSVSEKTPEAEIVIAR